MTTTRLPKMRRGPVPGPNARSVIERDQAVMSTSLTRPYPLVFAHGEGCWVTDVDGNTFLDFMAGIAVSTSGYNHPRVVAAIREQAERFIHAAGTDFYFESQVRLAERLVGHCFGAGQGRIFFGNSGTEAIEGAIKLARWATGRQQLIAFYGAFHGRTAGSLSLTASKAVQQHGFGPLLSGVHHVSYPSQAAGITTDQTIFELERLFQRTVPPSDVAAIFVEPIQGEGGYVVPPSDFLPRLAELCDRHGILLVMDEIQSGCGRTGRFLASEGVEPDIVCLAKGLASGLPISAIAARGDLMRWPAGAHGNTFGGNALACASALVTLDLLEEGLMANAGRVGDQLRSALEGLCHDYPALISDVRGRGLMIGVEMASHELAERLVTETFNQGLLTLTAGERTVRISPPLLLSDKEATLGAGIIAAAVSGLTSK